MPVKNKAMLITYSDSMGKNIKELQYILDKYIGDAIGGVHLLPFFRQPEIVVLRPRITLVSIRISVIGRMSRNLEKSII